ncbi:phosphate transport system regulatory protein PhoU [Ancylomarina euxinus]|uniref:Phosphate transport system regulatory protein PhoU n=1 Tax=Ancylomarina euxinus TaxID=2283627 RepID=A0A425Y1N7_9BACT|nr:phosphate signaling complex protein PhoU [Ancylomarina euxinus]MCZ4693710.1 phosphate signaling complex protein PhoU [Ancylomarina euxinus]MUP15210.1 phosphate signaling complex protein PhoU [Ancylomarina euxinus]RRG21630.1 phosphate transport system regulatory protein PhoU [Ancylomarina euxinus]
MSIKKDKKFEGINKDFQKMKSILYEQFETLENVILTGLDTLSKKERESFSKNEAKLDQLELKMSENIIQTIGLQQPMARELRQLISYLRMLGDMERIGDQLNNILHFFMDLTPKQLPENQRESIHNMYDMSLIMVKKALDSFENEDHETAIWTIQNDEVVDDMQRKLINRMLRKSTPPSVAIEDVTNILNFGSILSSIERIADNATNIAEASIYYQNGTDLRHKELPDSSEE